MSARGSFPENLAGCKHSSIHPDSKHKSYPLALAIFDSLSGNCVTALFAFVPCATGLQTMSPRSSDLEYCGAGGAPGACCLGVDPASEPLVPELQLCNGSAFQQFLQVRNVMFVCSEEGRRHFHIKEYPERKCIPIRTPLKQTVAGVRSVLDCFCVHLFPHFA